MEKAAPPANNNDATPTPGTMPVPPGDSNFAGRFGDGALEPYTEGQCNSIAFALDGTFRRNYTDHRRDASYGCLLYTSPSPRD